ncbi:hypothetical protein Tsubulata_019849 [Turnera subulata]|uniref:Rx N-terminal domain-containing protein n=1 Tax=Turnera subulata TaxID=218843 RepID=A0A9Q0IY31_9ROSI|nr:hypothetical protein Tsubulata_019849 [Turnera subulata]
MEIVLGVVVEAGVEYLAERLYSFFETALSFKEKLPLLKQALETMAKIVEEGAVGEEDITKVLEMESLFLTSDYSRVVLAHLLRAVQVQEKEKLHLTATIQVLKKSDRPSERLVNHQNCRFPKPLQHECAHLHEITEDAGTEEAEADAEYDNALKEAIRAHYLKERTISLRTVL